MVWAIRSCGSAPAEPAEYAVDTSASRVRVLLGRAGLLKRLGHAHLIEAPVTEGRVMVAADDPARSSGQLHFDAARLAVVPSSEPEGDVPRVAERMRGVSWGSSLPPSAEW